MKRNEIKKWMIDVGVTSTQIAKEARVSKALVSRVIKGERKNDLVTTLLLGHGCPMEFLVDTSETERALEGKDTTS